MATYRGVQNSASEVIDIPEDLFPEDKPKPDGKEKDPSSFEYSVPSLFDIVKPDEVWKAGKVHAQKTLNLYANIDILRPYFNVEPDEVYSRILQSLIPRFPSTYRSLAVPAELYGPLMLVLTLIALLLWGMKSSDHIVKEGTLMGTAFGVSFGYWLGATGLTFFLCFISNSSLSFFQLLSLIGYGISGHCFTLLLGTLFHPVHSHLYFYMLWLTFGGLTAAKMVSVVASRTPGGVSQQALVGGTLASLHLLDILYLHFAYHKTVEALSF